MVEPVMLTNATVNVTAGFTQEAAAYTFGELLPRILQLITAPLHNYNTLWMILPLVTMLLLMEFYFGRYSHEELGWNTAVGNSMVLVFVAIDLLRYIYGKNGLLYEDVLIQDIRVITFISVCVAIGGIWLLVMNFFHFMPKGLAFFISSSLPINLMAYIAIIIVYSSVTHPIALDWTTFWAAIGLFVILQGFFELVHLIEPKSKVIEE